MRIIGVLAWIAVFLAAPVRAELVQVPSRPGVTVPIAIEPPTGQAVAWALLFVGGNGTLKLDTTGAPTAPLSVLYIVTRRDVLKSAGIGVVLVDVPSDQRSGINPRFRRSEQHMADVAAVTTMIRQRFRRPVWLIGHSNGGITAAAVARALSGAARPDGLILASPTVMASRRDTSQPFPPFPYTGAALVAAHQGDSCRYSPPSDAALVSQAFSQARPNALRMFSGGSAGRGDPCLPLSLHSFHGMEREVMSAFAGFIRSGK